MVYHFFAKVLEGLAPSVLIPLHFFEMRFRLLSPPHPDLHLHIWGGGRGGSRHFLLVSGETLLPRYIAAAQLRSRLCAPAAAAFFPFGANSSSLIVGWERKGAKWSTSLYT